MADMDTKVLRWAHLFQPLIPIREDLRYNISVYGAGWGDGLGYGNGGGSGHGDGHELDSPWPNGDGYGASENGFQYGDGCCESL